MDSYVFILIYLKKKNRLLIECSEIIIGSKKIITNIYIYTFIYINIFFYLYYLFIYYYLLILFINDHSIKSKTEEMF